MDSTNQGRSECFFNIKTKEMCGFQLPFCLTLSSTGNNGEPVKYSFFKERHEKVFTVQQVECVVIRSIAF